MGNSVTNQKGMFWFTPKYNKKKFELESLNLFWGLDPWPLDPLDHTKF